MSFKCSVIVLVAILLSGIGSAHTQAAPLEYFKPSSLNQPGQEYPQVNSQGYARFRIKAPQADSVRVSLGLGGRGGTLLTKADSGYFIGTTAGPMDEGFHYYRVNVDGATFNDPGTLNYYGSTRWESGIEIPAREQDFYALKYVPHGHVQQIICPSKLMSSSSSGQCIPVPPPLNSQGAGSWVGPWSNRV